MNCNALVNTVIDPQIELLLVKLKQHDEDTYTHSMRVAEYCAWFADLLQMSKEERELFVISALLHDIGKLRIPGEILRKDAKLSDEEWSEIQKHPIYGMEYVEQLVTQGLVHPDVIMLHHENTDGSGYPTQSKVDVLPREVRMIRIIDSYDAMTSNRNYRRVKTKQEALEELQRCAGRLYDPELVDLFCRYLTNQ
ncbi:putative nucleotidyltransferase with HDIG domain [Paenibacillus phyllosphaerae]|uniref:Putative nucleotidyltransferase with HDIG domain n=1 Tax=Paenibacillus phyllosphaerae TaxID=274593 RepID=A0A7W5AW51_9BACL|nr:HD domain-containing phosphohydrolase [Paenibacillus phyllosphaerae]MBB3109808.1 putative nucleotidyltransferase with HDIG domain [Paenibacillus phyllosphaerae]